VRIERYEAEELAIRAVLGLEAVYGVDMKHLLKTKRTLSTILVREVIRKNQVNVERGLGYFLNAIWLGTPEIDTGAAWFGCDTH
jgi:hypothetical protein